MFSKLTRVDSLPENARGRTRGSLKCDHGTQNVLFTRLKEKRFSWLIVIARSMMWKNLKIHHVIAKRQTHMHVSPSQRVCANSMTDAHRACAFDSEHVVAL